MTLTKYQKDLISPRGVVVLSTVGKASGSTYALNKLIHDPSIQTLTIGGFKRYSMNHGRPQYHTHMESITLNDMKYRISLDPTKDLTIIYDNIGKNIDNPTEGIALKDLIKCIEERSTVTLVMVTDFHNMTSRGLLTSLGLLDFKGTDPNEVLYNPQTEATGVLSKSPILDKYVIHLKDCTCLDNPIFMKTNPSYADILKRTDDNRYFKGVFDGVTNNGRYL